MTHADKTSPTVLAFDTSAPHCAAAILQDGRIVASCAEPMSRGQAERLMPLLQELLTRTGIAWADLDAVGVGIGPGNFTGIRIAVSAARGLALGLGIPAVGVSGFDALAELAPTGVIPAVAAPRNQVYVNLDQTPRLLSQDQASAIGSLYFCHDPDQQAQAIARVASRRWTTVSAPPAPLYVRPADAAPSRDTPPVLLDE